MCKNVNLAEAKKNRNDEFYTQLSDIEKELIHYTDKLKDKIIYCNCDNPDWSNFYKYFKNNFSTLGIKKLISTFYSETEKAYKTIYDGKKEIKICLNGNGDFKSDECMEILKEIDIVITNPPFSLFRDFISTLMLSKKQFIIIGNKNAITYKEIFPLFLNNQIYLGHNSGKGSMYFSTPNKELKSIASFWYTSYEIENTNKITLTQNYESNKYPKYDNYDAINVDKTINIPKDYNKVMGVPITYLLYHNPDLFKIVGEFNHGSDGDFDLAKPILNKKVLYKKIAIQRHSGEV